MKEVQETYLAILRAALWGDELRSECVNGLTGERLLKVIRLVAFHGTGPLVYDQLLKLQDLEIPADLRMQMKQQCVQSMMLHQSMLSILSKAWHSLVNIGVHPVLLKGFALAQYYPQPHLRQWGDIDLYVGECNYYKACDALREAFPGIEHTEHEEDNNRHYNFVFDNTVLETHRVSAVFYHPRDRRYYKRLEAKNLTKEAPTIKMEGLVLKVPEDTFNVFYTFLHAWNHFVETGMNMKQLSDIAILLHNKRKAINVKQLHEMLFKLHLMDVWQLIMYIMVHYLGVIQDECPFYTEKCGERAELLFEHIMSEGSSRLEKKLNTSGLSYLKRKWLTFQLRMADSCLVRPYAPRYARHMVVSDILHGLERFFAGK